MIKLKNGHEIKYNRDFDQFFTTLLKEIIKQSKASAEIILSKQTDNKSQNDIFMKELMDNCIYVTHQLLEIHKENEELSKFMVAGFIFNSILLTIPQKELSLAKNKSSLDDEIIH